MRKSAFDKTDQNGEVAEISVSNFAETPIENDEEGELNKVTTNLRRVTRSRGKTQKKGIYNINASFQHSDSNHQSCASSDEDMEGDDPAENQHIK